MALKVQLKEGGPRGYFRNCLLTFYLVMSYMAVASKGQRTSNKGKETTEHEQKMVAACRTRLRELVANMEVRGQAELLPARLLAEDFLGISTILHREQVTKMYQEAAEERLPALFRPMAFLLHQVCLLYSSRQSLSTVLQA